jgi:hypothetical protein
MLKPILLVEDDARDLELTLVALERSQLANNANVVKPVEFNAFVAAIADLGVFWAVLNEPPPGSTRASRRHD